MGGMKPAGLLVIEVGEGALHQDLCCRLVPREEAVGVALHHLRHAYDKVRRVQPVMAQLI